MKSLSVILKPIVAALLLVLGSFTAPAQEQGNRKQLFDFDWKFRLEDDTSFRNSSYDDGAWRSLDLPHDWSIEGQPSPHHPSGNDGGYFPTEKGWCRDQ